MILGMSVSTFTLVHVLLSLVGIFAGLVVVYGFLKGRLLEGWNGVFLVTTILTSVTGFLFPPKPIGPPFIFGVVSLVVLAIALYALYGRKLAGGWRRVFLVTALFAQWLNMVVLVVQSYQKVPALHALAPLGNEPAVLATQAVVAVVILYFVWATLRRPAA